MWKRREKTKMKRNKCFVVLMNKAACSPSVVVVVLQYKIIAEKKKEREVLAFKHIKFTTWHYQQDVESDHLL